MSRREFSGNLEDTAPGERTSGVAKVADDGKPAVRLSPIALSSVS